jgi:hypothetical protein
MDMSKLLTFYTKVWKFTRKKPKYVAHSGIPSIDVGKGRIIFYNPHFGDWGVHNSTQPLTRTMNNFQQVTTHNEFGRRPVGPKSSWCQSFQV